MYWDAVVKWSFRALRSERERPERDVLKGIDIGRLAISVLITGFQVSEV